jgi:hypothetical protein
MENNQNTTADTIYVMAITIFVLCLSFGASFILNIGLCVRLRRLADYKQKHGEINLGLAATYRESEPIEWPPPPSPPPEALQSSSPVASLPEFNRPFPQQTNHHEDVNIYDDVNIQESRPLPQTIRPKDENIYNVPPGVKPLPQPNKPADEIIYDDVPPGVRPPPQANKPKAEVIYDDLPLGVRPLPQPIKVEDETIYDDVPWGVRPHFKLFNYSP